jgi:2-succinyl-6-hydroxy-2,4-cyclohexadiene-1-carboxylate synthase
VVRVIALHGFLGGPADWDIVRAALPWCELEAVDLWPFTGGQLAGPPWAEIDRVLEREIRERARRVPLAPTVVLGYSFGARLALAVEALELGTLPVAGVCLVSCHPGLAEDDLDVRARRRVADEEWARRFETDDEEAIRTAWDVQPVLAAPASAPGRRDDHAGKRQLPAARTTLAVAMRRFSLAGQPDFSPRLARWRTPLLWVTGEDDWKYDNLAGWLQQGGARAEFASCPHAGHRVPWDNPEAFAAIVRRWLADVPGVRT